MTDFQISRSVFLLVIHICIASVVHIISLSTQGWHNGYENVGLFPQGNIPDWWKLTQAAMVLGLMCLMISEVCAIISLLSKQKYYPNDKRIIAGFLLLGFIFTTGSWITFAVEMRKEDNRFLLGLASDSEESFSYSFGLAVVSSILSFLLIIQTWIVKKGEYDDPYPTDAQIGESIYDNNSLVLRPANGKDGGVNSTKIPSTAKDNYSANPVYRDSFNPENVDNSRWSVSELYNFHGVPKSMSNQEFNFVL
ncbi:DgyrCDS2630 [Dimorphilus gyrociliatus]|uniref:DgyrCDS2630 n=1 Tax=Dimorphilus gyrociliatus TaxID=2664684 RepID=A0A7I8VBA7_9ANNE|nr:DgyrCDS2630 [Dimorphilus gyrociliatus]